jgi:hypothetical protein
MITIQDAPGPGPLGRSRPQGVETDSGPRRSDLASRRWRHIEGFVLFLAIGYLVDGRSFAYIGIAKLNLFIGELSLFLAVLGRATRRAFHDWVAILLRPHRWHGVMVLITLLLVLGFFSVARGVAHGDGALTTLKNLPFNYYVFFLILGLWIGQRSDRLLERFAWGLAVTNAVYGVPAVLILSKLHATIPGTGGLDGGAVPIFSVGTASGMAILALLAFPLPVKWRKWTPVLLVGNGFVLLAQQQRSEWVGFLVGFFLFCLLKHRLKTFVASFLVTAAILGLIGLAGISISGSGSRGGQVSLAGITGRAIAPFDPTLATKLVGTQSANAYASTKDWRTTWWTAIWKSSQQNATTAVFGHGYGYELRQLAPYVPPDTRTPHNVFFYALGYTGWLGVAIFFGLWAGLLSKLYKVFRVTGNPFGLAFVAVAFGLGLLGNWFETPFGAAPTYLVVGMALAPLGGFSVGGGRRRAVSARKRSAANAERCRAGAVPVEPRLLPT